jgi:hypothetical protein
VKAAPWLLRLKSTSTLWALFGVLLVAHPGQRLGRLDAAQGWISKQRNRASYSLWFATSLKLLWDGLSDYLA